MISNCQPQAVPPHGDAVNSPDVEPPTVPSGGFSKKLKVLVACEYSGRVRNAFNSLGHESWSCDLLPADDNGGTHIQDSLEHVIGGGNIHWDLLIAHPPCTYLSNSGVCHLKTDPSRWEKMEDAAYFFKWILDLPIDRIAVENPVMHGHGLNIIGRKATQFVQPYMFGHMETKMTGLWLNGLMPLRPVTNLKEQTMALPANVRQRLHYLPPSPTRWKERSTTYQGIADAMAMQWGGDARGVAL